MNEARGTGASDRLHGVIWSELRRLVREPDGSDKEMALADVQAVKATDRLLAALRESGAVIAEAADVAVLTRVAEVLKPLPVWLNGDEESREWAIAEDALIRAAMDIMPDDLARLAALIERAKGGG